MPIQKPKQQGGFQETKFFRAGMGAAQGAAKGAAMGGPTGAVVGAVVGGVSALSPDSPMKRAVGMYEMGKSIGGGGGGAPAKTTDGVPELHKPEMGAPDAFGQARQPSLMGNASPMERRMSIMQQSPEFQLQSGLDHIETLDVSPEVKAQLAEPIVRAQVYGNRPQMRRPNGY